MDSSVLSHLLECYLASCLFHCVKWVSKQDFPGSMTFVGGGNTNPIDDGPKDGLNTIRAKGFAHSQPTNPKISRNRVDSVERFARNQPIN